MTLSAWISIQMTWNLENFTIQLLKNSIFHFFYFQTKKIIQFLLWFSEKIRSRKNFIVIKIPDF